MPKTEAEKRAWHNQAYGDDYWDYKHPITGKSNKEQHVNMYMGNKAMAAMSILSDVQELIEQMVDPVRAPEWDTKRAETCRQWINKAKSLIGELAEEHHNTVTGGGQS